MTTDLMAELELWKEALEHQAQKCRSAGEEWMFYVYWISDIYTRMYPLVLSQERTSK